MFKDYFVTPGVAPPWILGAVGKAKLQMLGTTLDQLTGEVGGKSGYAAQVGMPTKCDATALPLIGNDRLLVQGQSEPTATFRLRLKSAFDTWRQFAGNDWGILIQALSQVTGLNGATAPRARIVSNSGVWSWFEAGADTTQPPWWATGAWLWDLLGPGSPDMAASATTGAWWRVWLSLESVGGAAFAAQWPTLGTGGQATLGNLTTGSVGFQNVAPSVWTQLRGVLETFRSKQAAIRWILVTFSTSVIGPTGTNPDGTWGYGYKISSGQYVATWAANVLPVPGAFGAQSTGSTNSASNAAFGYRIVNGQYIAY